jgi:hypothetical protein
MTDSIQVPVSNKYEIETWTHKPPFRTTEQFEAVKNLVAQPEFNFSCNSMVFDDEGSGSKFQKTFTFMWFSKNHTLHCTRISPKGGLRDKTA